MEPEDQSPGHARRLWIVVALAYLATRWLLIWDAQAGAALAMNPGLDEDLHWRAAGLLLGGADQREPNFELMLPSSMSFTYLIALVRALSFDSVVIAKLLYSFVGLGTCLLLLQIARRLSFHAGSALILPGLYILTPTLAYFDVMLMKSNLQLLLVAAVCSSILAARKERALARGRLALIYLALALLCSIELGAVITAAAAVAGLWMFVPMTRPRKALLALLLVTAPVVPMTVKSVFVSGARYPWFVPQAGVHLAIGNNEDNAGYYSKVEDVPPWPHGHVFAGRLVAERNRGVVSSFEEANTYFVSVALSRIWAHPWEFAKRTAKKTAHFFNDYEVKGVDLFAYERGHSIVLGLLPLSFGMCFVLAVCGLLFRREREQVRASLFLVLLMLAPFAMVQASFVTYRYRIDVWIPLLILAALGLRTIASRPRTLEGNVGLIAAALAAAAFTFYPFEFDRRLHQFKEAETNVSHRAKVKKNLEETKVHPVCTHRPAKLDDSYRFTAAYRCLKETEQRGQLSQAEESLLIKYLLWLGDYDQVREYIAKSRHRYQERPAFLSELEFEILRTQVSASGPR